MLDKCKELFDSWNRNMLNYCHWKSNEHLLPGLEGKTDLDVLLSKDDKLAGEAILHKLEFLQCKSQFGSRYPNVEDWVGFDETTGSLIHLHLHYELVTGHKGMKEYSLPWTALALQTRILDEENGVYTMEPNLEMMTLYTRIGLKADFLSLTHSILGKYKLPKDVQNEIDWLKKRADIEKVHQYLYTYYGSRADDVFSIIMTDTIDATIFRKLRKIAESTFKKNSRVKCFRRLLEVFHFVYQIKLKHIIHKFTPIISKKVPISGKGISLALIGQDGSGKSTVTMEIEKWLRWKIDAQRFYLGSGEHYNGFLKTIISKGTKYKHGNNTTKKIEEKGNFNAKQKKRKKNLKNLIAAVLVSLNHLNVARRAYNVVGRSEKYRNRGGIPLFDRFPQVQFEGIYDGPKVSNYIRETGLDFLFVRWIARREKRIIQKIQNHQPQLVFKLMLPPEESIRRKPFENLAAVTRKHEITKQLEFPNAKVFSVDATQDYKNELLFIKNEIWKELIKSQS